MKRQERADFIRKELGKMYKNPKPPLDFSNPFTLLIAVLLSAQCTDERVNIVTKTLFKKAKTPKAMHALGIPTTRSLAVVMTGEHVARENHLPGAILTRVAASHIRVGTFEYVANRGNEADIQTLCHYAINRHYPEIKTDNPALALLENVMIHQIDLMVHWMRVGFVHGVMNTDNMSISGLTIDYGPYGWLEGYDPMWTPNTTDAQGKRYCYGRQPDIALWNLVQLANALFTIVPDEDALKSGLELYKSTYSEHWHRELGKKLGLTKTEDQDNDLFEGLLSVLQTVETDWTLFFRLLAKIDVSKGPPTFLDATQTLKPAFYEPFSDSEKHKPLLEDWLSRYSKRTSIEMATPLEREKLMNSVNPKFILRNYVTQIAIDDASEGNYSTIKDLLAMLRNPFSEDIDPDEKFTSRRPEWAKDKAGCSMLSCSS